MAFLYIYLWKIRVSVYSVTLSVTLRPLPRFCRSQGPLSCSQRIISGERVLILKTILLVRNTYPSLLKILGRGDVPSCASSGVFKGTLCIH